MKVTFVYPKFNKFLDSHPGLKDELTHYFLGSFTTPPSLGIPILASWTPPEVEIEFVDDNSGDPLCPESETDLVAINCFTPQARRAFEIADLYRARGRKVIMGGMFPSFRVEECLQHADAVNVGEGEPTWPQILRDAAAGALQRVYKGGSRFDLSRMRPPRRDLFYSRSQYDWDEDLVQLTRGCPFNCAMCVLPAHMGSHIRFRPIPQVVDEIRNLRFENVYLADDTLFLENRRIRAYTLELLQALQGAGKRYFVSSTLALNRDPALMTLMAKAGVANFYCTLNVDPVSKSAIAGKGPERRLLADLVKQLEDLGIRFFASFAVGRDWDDASIADRILELSAETGVRTAEFFLFTPYPGGLHWDRLESQQRLIDRDWSHYNGAHVVFRPQLMSPDTLLEQFLKVWRGFYRAQGSVARHEPSTWREGIQVVGKPLDRQGVVAQPAIVGLGVLSPIGNDAPAMLDALRQARHGLAPITRFDTSSFRTSIGGEVRGAEVPPLVNAGEVARYGDIYLAWAISAARVALREAGCLAPDGHAKEPMAMVLGTCNGGLLSAEEEYRWLHGRSTRHFSALDNLRSQYYGFAKAMAHALGLRGETWLVTTACSTTTAALGLAGDLIRRGDYRRVLVGGADSLCLSNMAGFDALKATSTGRTAPFSLPPGINIGEGAAFWVLEDMAQALLSDRPILGRLLGSAITSDAHHPTAPDPRGEGVSRTLRKVMEDSGLDLAELGCINAHGTGTEANDVAETKGLLRVFGNRPPVPVVSLKSFFGHAMGVTGLLEATANLLAMNDGFIPPTLNFSGPRPGCTLDYVPNQPRPSTYRAFLSANYAFGGNNAAVALARADFPAKPPATRRRPVVVTGLGAITPVGLSVQSLLAALRERRRGIGPVERLGLGKLDSGRAGLVPEYRAADVDRRLNFAGMNGITRYAVTAASQALAQAGIRVTPRNADAVGIAVGLCNGTPESPYMNSVFAKPVIEASVTAFPQVAPSSVAGFVAEALCCKGVNITLAPGPHAGLQSLAYAWRTVAGGKADVMLATAADEVYDQMFWNYDYMKYLWPDADAEAFRLRADDAVRKVVGEGAAVLALEPLDAARARGARPLAEILGYAGSMDADAFEGPCLASAGLQDACRLALERAGVGPGEVDLVVWAPQGNAQDDKMLEALRGVLGPDIGGLPLVTTTFNTGYSESASILVSLAACLAALQGAEGGLWPQLTGAEWIDRRTATRPIRNLLALGSTDIGLNQALVLRAGEPV
jgi:3-oxoacyl-[acyl-carrier-protein] synthase II